MFRFKPKIGRFQYKMDWKGYGPDKRSWTEHIEDCSKAVADFWCNRFLNDVVENEERIIRENKAFNPDEQDTDQSELALIEQVN